MSKRDREPSGSESQHLGSPGQPDAVGDNCESLTRRRLVDLNLSAHAAITLHRLSKRSREAVWAGTRWLSALEVGRLGSPQNPDATVAHTWMRERRIFGIACQDTIWFPRYAFADDGQPVVVMAAVLDVLHTYSAERLAAWHESTSNFLAGRRPRELLMIDPQLVLAAARHAMESEAFSG